MFRVHRDFKGLLKAAQDEYDSLVELNMSMQTIGAAAGTQHLQRHSVRSAEMEVLS